MDAAEAFGNMLVESDLVAFSFALRTPDFDAEATSNLVGWLAEEFTLRRCDWLASAITSVTGREHHVAFLHPDRRLAHAVVSASPQYDLALRGRGCDILGRRPLSKIAAELNSLNRHLFVEIGGAMPTGDFDDGELGDMVELAANLPWTASLVRRPTPKPDGRTLADIARRLGMPE